MSDYWITLTDSFKELSSVNRRRKIINMELEELYSRHNKLVEEIIIMLKNIDIDTAKIY